MCVIQKTLPCKRNIMRIKLTRGDRLPGIHVTMSRNHDYVDAFTKAKFLGAEFVTISPAWDDIEKSPGVYKNENLAIANSYYLSQNTRIVKVLSPI